ncbi:helix-turn-helix transcriptional regulator [Catenulispora sp. NF23]|uniref:Helix-turn-helix transcriptional regulator n=1 Tax=Catenulispora pinistramenti TaxID=2705254 RepID=A0ABS5KWT3_9ACTN|nr:helix-turn-helix domain-containing protein [Catenulispora pinistramenti]MBS2535616.1 helix-turn-helix transcriptional regulator [Catenulispora pinistramenti]MBS2550513.1 helix-turn-helix transcriptional regulator [Catenulispora pinistramenti]
METIDYGTGDLGRVRFVLSPLGHLIHGVHDGPCSRQSPWRQRWWPRARRQVSLGNGRLVPLINRAHPDAPAFLPLAIAGDAAAPTFEQELDQLRATPPHLLGYRLAAGSGPGPGRTDEADRLIRGLRNQEDASLRAVVDGLLALYRATLMADWPTVAERLQRDISMRQRQIQRHGALAMMTNLHSDITWRPRTDAEGPGPGLILAPCLFGQQRTHGGPGADGTQVVIYPTAELDESYTAPDDHLAALLGAGRAAVLRTLRVPASTSGLARRLGISAPMASTHATLLRNAGLVSTTRDGKSVRHDLTAVGRQLVELNPEGIEL